MWELLSRGPCLPLLHRRRVPQQHAPRAFGQPLSGRVRIPPHVQHLRRPALRVLLLVPSAAAQRSGLPSGASGARVPVRHHPLCRRHHHGAASGNPRPPDQVRGGEFEARRVERRDACPAINHQDVRHAAGAQTRGRRHHVHGRPSRARPQDQQHEPRLRSGLLLPQARHRARVQAAHPHRGGPIPLRTVPVPRDCHHGRVV
mmetsp:Transcript_39395/g.93309  ORF Transcript_39395/g.93309 Transcript_39395/m.93309 type:complete len:202 (+) Transcript_39395:113-718(+)